ncbi:MAG: Glu/Leu/Phe/Val dehydrogenase dimerization domain-containing protein, partial [Alphaproteobacteria bacterium]
MSTVVSQSDKRPRTEDITAEARRNDAWRDHEQVLRVTDPASGLHAIIAIHDTTLGPALGGTRVWPYDTEQDALTDVLRLSEGMTLKAALARTPTGGGKA